MLDVFNFFIIEVARSEDSLFLTPFFFFIFTDIFGRSHLLDVMSGWQGLGILSLL